MPPKTPAELRAYTRQQVKQSEERLQSQIDDLSGRVRALESEVTALQDQVEELQGGNVPLPPDEPDTPEPPPQEPYDAIDIHSVRFLEAPEVRGWPVTSIMIDASATDEHQMLMHTKAGQWRVYQPEDNGGAEGNCWVIAAPGRDGEWVASTWEWLRPGQTDKHVKAKEFGAHTKKVEFASWVPMTGDVLYLFVSTPVRAGADTGQYERSNIVKVVWK